MTTKRQTNTKNTTQKESAKADKTIPAYVTSEAWAWLNSWVWAPKKPTEKSPEPKAYPPLWYVGPELLKRYSDLVGHPLTLDEVQYLVRPDVDGEAICMVTGEPFIPIIYPSEYIPDEIAERLRTGTPLSTAHIYTRGQFNVVRKDVLPLSGSIYREVQTPAGEKEFDYAYQSHIVLLASKLMARRHSRHPIWTCVSKESLSRRKEQQQARQVVHDRLWALAGEIEEEYQERKDRRKGRITSVKNAMEGAVKIRGRKKHQVVAEVN